MDEDANCGRNVKDGEEGRGTWKKERGRVIHHKIEHWKEMDGEVDVICVSANTELTGCTVVQKRVASLRQ